MFRTEKIIIKTALLYREGCVKDVQTLRMLFYEFFLVNMPYQHVSYFRPLPRYYVTTIENCYMSTYSHSVNINIKFVSHNAAKERHQLILNLLCKM